MRYRTKVAIKTVLMFALTIFITLDFLWNLLCAVGHHGGKYGFAKDMGEATAHIGFAILSLFVLTIISRKPE